jgi:hypothetical protein
MYDLNKILSGVRDLFLSKNLVMPRLTLTDIVPIPQKLLQAFESEAISKSNSQSTMEFVKNRDGFEFIIGYYSGSSLPLPVEHSWVRYKGRDYDLFTQSNRWLSNQAYIYLELASFTKSELASVVRAPHAFSAVTLDKLGNYKITKTA